MPSLSKNERHMDAAEHGLALPGEFTAFAMALLHVRKANERILGISRSRSRTFAVIRARVRSRAFSNPSPSSACLVRGTVRGAKRRNGESGSVAQAEMSLKNVRLSVSQECAVSRTSSPVPAPRRLQYFSVCQQSTAPEVFVQWPPLVARAEFPKSAPK